MKLSTGRVFTIAIIITLCNAKGFGPGEQDYGYVTVRPGAHMFWWLYHTTANVSDSAERPLIIWLQGGPGGSSCGIGNFEIIGPLDLDLQPRNHTWVKDFNVLFIDNPVGTGYSYVEDLRLLATSNRQIGEDLVALTLGFYERLPSFATTPLYVYGQSYGGKMAVDFARMLAERGLPVMGIAAGDAWISPVEITLTWAPYLREFGLVDAKGEQMIMTQAKRIKEAFEAGQYANATEQWTLTQFEVFEATEGVDFYNIMNKRRGGGKVELSPKKMAFHRMAGSTRELDLLSLMNGPVREALDIPEVVYWGSQSFDVFSYLEEDFMKPATQSIENLLQETYMKVHAYNGNLDLICDTPGQMTWVNGLRWPASEEFHTAPRTTIWVNDTMEGYARSGGNFTFFWINAAGHSAPADNPAAIRMALESMTGI